MSSRLFLVTGEVTPDSRQEMHGKKLAAETQMESSGQQCSAFLSFRYGTNLKIMSPSRNQLNFNLTKLFFLNISGKFFLTHSMDHKILILSKIADHGHQKCFCLFIFSLPNARYWDTRMSLSLGLMIIGPGNHNAVYMCNMFASCDVTYPTKCVDSCMNPSIFSLTITDMLRVSNTMELECCTRYRPS
jgi:hypothetical protein